MPLFALSLIMFSISTIFGFYLGDNVNPVVFEGVISSFPDPGETNFIGLVSFFAINNITASLLFIISGLVLGIPPLLLIALNGFFIGWSVYTYAKDFGLWLVAALILPHGVIEIPAITFSAAMGMGLGYQLIHQMAAVIETGLIMLFP
jgi:stage II sporulation protein M